MSRSLKKDYRDAIAAICRAHTLNPDESQKQRLDELSRSINTQASAGAVKYLHLIRQVKDSSWFDEFLSFRDDFQFTNVAQEVMATFTELRARHQEAAKKAFGEGASCFSKASKTMAMPSTVKSSRSTTPLRSIASRSVGSKTGSKHAGLLPENWSSRNESL